MDAIYVAAIAALLFVTVALAAGCDKLGERG
jgi:hypothetical protein